MKRLFVAAFLLTSSALALSVAAHAQQEGPVSTQTLVNVDPKSTPPSNASALTVAVNDHKEPLTAWSPVVPADAQVALLIDDGLRESLGRELDNLRSFIRNLSPGVEILVGYLQYGHVVAEQPFTTDYAQAASVIHLPEGVAGMSASPYLCISDFVRKWPGPASPSSAMTPIASGHHKARFILLLSNGVDPYNGSTSPMNQDSPYVAAAIRDAQRAGVTVYTIYFGDAGMRGGSVDFSGQGYLQQLTEGTGGVNLWEGTGNPQSTAPFLQMFQHAIAETYVATFIAPANSDPQSLVRVKFSAGKAKLRSPELVRPGNQE